MNIEKSIICKAPFQMIKYPLNQILNMFNKKSQLLPKTKEQCNVMHSAHRKVCPGACFKKQVY